MGEKQVRKEVGFDQCFPEDIEQYYSLMESYVNLTTEDFATAFELSKLALIQSDRWSDITANADKLAKANGFRKTDLSDYCYRKYRTLQLAHEHCRGIWRVGEDGLRQQR